MAGVAILGFGVVGSGVAEVIAQNHTHIGQKLHSNLDLKYILDVKDFPESPFRDLVIHDFSLIEKDPEIEVVVETIGGAKIAKEFTERALRAGKSVVTSNKELVATFGYELMLLAQKNNVSYLYEASVGGGIPIIRPLKQCLAANEISEIYGILNGTTNYILSRMIHAGLSFEDALAEAQSLGYAEADPSSDIEGIDACRKICILASLAFGAHVVPQKVSTEGIGHVNLSDVAYAASCGCKIKLLGRAVRKMDGRLRIFVAPHLIPDQDPLAGVEAVFNAITVRGNAIGNVMFYGQGAGKLPTASAVVADLMEAVSRKNDPKYLDWGPGEEDATVPDDGTYIWYVRMKNCDTMPCRMKRLHIAEAPEGESAFLSDPMTLADLDECLRDLEVYAAFRVLKDDQ